jgi:hypothetical protein
MRQSYFNIQLIDYVKSLSFRKSVKYQCRRVAFLYINVYLEAEELSSAAFEYYKYPLLCSEHPA